MIRLSLLLVVMLFSIGEGRFYRASPKTLKSQDATDIAPTSDYVDQSYQGFINYEGGEVNDNKEVLKLFYFDIFVGDLQRAFARVEIQKIFFRF